jgi:hypothetical protein
MKGAGWDVIILDDPEHSHLVAEVHYDGHFLCLLSRDEGRDSIRVELPGTSGRRVSVALEELVEKLKAAAEDLKR